MKSNLFLDLDDVILDTSNYAFEFHGVKSPYLDKQNIGKRKIHKLVGMSWQKFWGDLPFEFWANIPKMPWADDLIKLAVEYFGDNVFFLTSPIRTAACAGGKMEWCEKTYPALSPNLVIAHPKWVLVDEEGLLIDDSYFNEKDFKEKDKGDSFDLFPSLQNRFYEQAVLYRANPKLVMADYKNLFESISE